MMKKITFVVLLFWFLAFANFFYCLGAHNHLWTLAKWHQGW